MKTKENLEIIKLGGCIRKEYIVNYKGVDYIYSISYEDDMFKDEEIKRTDDIKIKENEEKKILDIIDKIDNWNDIE